MALYNRIGRLGFSKYVFISQVQLVDTITVASPLTDIIDTVPIEDSLSYSQFEVSETGFLVGSVAITTSSDTGYVAFTEVIAVTASFGISNEDAKVESGMILWNLHIRNLETATYWEGASDYWSWDI